MFNTKTLTITALSVILSGITLSAQASPGDDGCVGNCAPKGNGNNGGQPTNVETNNTNRNTNRSNSNAAAGATAIQGQGQLQGQNQRQGQGQAQGQIGINSSENANTASGGSSNSSGSGSGTGGNASADGALTSTVGDAVNNGGSLSNVVEGDSFTTIYLPDPVQLNPAMNTQPGAEAVCHDLAIRADYTGGDTTGVTLYVVSFYNQTTPSDVPAEMKEGFQAVVTCGLTNQLMRVIGESQLEKDIKVATQRMVVDALLRQIFANQGLEYTPRMLDLESVGMNGFVTLPFYPISAE